MDESDVRYYSTAPQFYQLVKRMDPSYFEFSLCNVFFEKLSDILEQMSVTLELSSDRRDALYRENYKASKPLPPEVYLQQNNMRLMADILSMESNGGTVSARESKEDSTLEEKPFSNLIDCFKTMLGFCNGNLVNNFWSGNVDEFYRYFEELESPTTSWRKLRDLLLRLECGMRRTLFLPQWWNNLGHTRLTRTTVEDRERLMKEAQRRKKDEREAVDVFDEDIIVVKHTKLAHGISRELTRMRDEKYRLFGRGELGGWIWISRTLVRDIRFPSDGSGELLHSISIEEEDVKNRKSTNIETIVSRLKEWRLAQETGCRHQKSDVCYSPSCRSGAVMRPVCSSDTTAGYQTCYSQDCRRNKSNLDGMLNLSSSLDELETLSVDTSRVVKAYDQSKTPAPRTGVLGEDLPWPLPEVHRFISRGSKRTSIFVIPQVTLRRLAKSGGRKAIYVPSFSSTAKGNLQYWNYPAPRPCFDLCWRWLTANCTSLQSVALQLRILWASVRWLDMKPEDDDPDRRFVLHFPDRDERRWISLHKEYGPPCIYERYRISIEVLPLDDDNNEEEDDLSWTSNDRDRRKSMRRRKTVQSSNVRRISHIKEEWVDGVDLKLYEIYDYWKSYNSRPVGGNKQLSQIQRTHSTPASGDQSTSSAQNVSSSRNVVAAQGRLRYPSSRSSSASASVLHAPMFATERKRKPQYLQDYEYYGFDDDDVDDNETGDSTYSEGSELTGWEPRAAKRQRLVSRMNSKQTFRTASPATRSLRDRSYQVDTVRRGGRETLPVGDGMEHVDLIEEGVVPLGAEETIVTTDCDNETSSRLPISSTRQIFRNDTDVGGPPAVQSRTQSTPARVIMPTRTETRPVRTGFSQPVDPFMKRMAVEKAVSGADVPSGLVRRQVIRPAESYEQVPYVDDKTGENVSYTEQVRTTAVRTSVSSGYDHSSALRRVTTPRGSMMASQGIQPNHNPHRVYYVKNVVATPPSRIVLAPTSVDTNDHEEIFLDNDGYVIDGGEIEDHTTTTHLS
uniref:DDT domain-containing protein n=1 Tax=Angiostrongylus cantonensis TaxID=6313 RepID=A0A158P7K1_ANGCA